MIDTATRRVVGWRLGARLDAALCTAALEMAARNGHLAVDAIFHSNRGQYTSTAFAATGRRLRVRQSMGGTGVCWDVNAMAETFFASLKIESIYRVVLPTVGHARPVVSRYIEVFYNRHRRHGALDYQTPATSASTCSPQPAG